MEPTRWLESGKLDFAMGSFRSMPKGIRCQPLWVERGAARPSTAVARADIARLRRGEAVMVSIAGSGHAHEIMQRALEAAIPRENVVCRIPIFAGALLNGGTADRPAGRSRFPHGLPHAGR